MTSRCPRNLDARHTSYTYNGDGLRTGRGGASATTFRWDVNGGLPLLLVDGSTAYVYGLGTAPIAKIDSTAELTYHHDQVGSIRAVTDSTGTVVATYSYDPYGNPTGSTGSVSNPFGYAGEYRDPESGLIYLRARLYDPATGQSLTRDPLEARTRSAYGYVFGNPLNGTDPTGLWGFRFPDWVPGLGGMCMSNEPWCASPYQGGETILSEGISDFAGGVLEVNPITSWLPLDLAGHGVNSSSGAFTAGKLSMIALETSLGFGNVRGVAGANTGSSLFYAASVCGEVRSGSCPDALLALGFSGMASVLGFNLHGAPGKPGLEWMGHMWNAYSNITAGLNPTQWWNDC